MSIRQYALLIGIEYVGTPKELVGCRRDVRRFQRFLHTRFGYKKDEVHLLLEERATHVGIQAALEQCVQRALKDPLRLIVYFSGHGKGVRGRSTGGEEDNQDEALVPFDYQTAGLLTDDVLVTFLARLPRETKCLCVWDCCNSGSMADLGFVVRGSRLVRDKGGPVCPATIDLGFVVRGSRLVKAKGGQVCPATIVSVSGCHDNQNSSLVKGPGGEWDSALTSAFVRVFRWEHTLPRFGQQLNAYMRKHRLRQRTVISTSREVGLEQPMGEFLWSPAPTDSPNIQEPRPVVDLLGAQERLGRASAAGDLVVVRRAVAAGAEVDNAVYHGYDGSLGGACTALFQAAWKGHDNVLRFLLTDAGADPNKGDTKLDRTPCHSACLQGHVVCVRLLLAKGADPNRTGKDGETPCTYAASRGHVNCLRALAEVGAFTSLNAVLRDGPDAGKTALDLAIERNQSAAVAYLRDDMRAKRAPRD